MGEICTDNSGQWHSPLVVAPPLCVAKDTNDLRYLPSNEKSKGRRRLSPRKANVAF